MIKAGIIILFLTCLLASLSRGAVILPLILPEPEEIDEAFREGLIDYEQYQALLEISRLGRLDHTDSVYIADFHDLLIGFSPNPIYAPQTDSINFDSTAAEEAPDQITASILYRQYQKLDVVDEKKRLLRVKSGNSRLRFYGEFETAYSGLKKWGRRNLTYTTSSAEYEVDVGIGSFRDEFGMGLVYGYHGQLLEKEDSPDELEKILFPRYGGSNGLAVTATNDASQYRFVFDMDRNGEHVKRFLGLSGTLPYTDQAVTISAAYGLLRNRSDDRTIDAVYMSLYDRITQRVGSFKYEVALALLEGNLFSAISSNLRRRSHKSTFQLSFWHYDGRFPSWFSGGPSSRRYRTIYEDAIELSYHDRFAGESGGIARSDLEISNNMRLLTLVGYSWRDVGDNRFEGRTGVTKFWRKRYSAGVDFYWRVDNVDFNQHTQKRLQIQLIRQSGFLSTRAVVGHRLDDQTRNDNLFVYIENRVKERYGELKLFFKLDRLEPGKLQNNYLYFSISHQTSLSHRLNSYIKYTYRYRRGQPEDNYGVLRWDFNYEIR